MSIDFYNKKAEEFINSTIDLDVTSLYTRFLSKLEKGAHILDAGCGSGRDSQAFIDLGFKVTAFDGSIEMVKTTESLIKQSVIHCLFHEFQSPDKFDGIWACASILHVPESEQIAVFNNLATSLKSAGIFYVSYKYGEKNMEKNGRRFTNATEKRLKQFISGTGLIIQETWITADLRPGREDEKWLNGILSKN